jgi:transposase
MAATIHDVQSIEMGRTLFVAVELAAKRWHLAIASGPGDAPRECEIAPGDAVAWEREVARAKARFGLTPDAPVVSCYEAGRDGFWVARWLARAGVRNFVVDSSSIEVPRRGRHPKTDPVDSRSLLRLLMRYAAGERRAWRVVTVPTVETEDRRQLHRAQETLKHDRTRIRNRIGSLLATQGIRLSRTRRPADLRQLRAWDGAQLPPGLQRRLQREIVHLTLVTQQIRSLEAEQRAAVRDQRDEVVKRVAQLQQLRGIALPSAWVFVMEAFSWRRFRNGREIGALSGLAPTPYGSGTSRREQGIGKTGNRRWRTMAVEIAWGWLRYQRDSDLSRWYLKRFADAGPRARRIGVVALARKLLIALWRYLETGVPPSGARLKKLATTA